MKRRLKSYLKLNLISIFFLALSFMSITMAWFAYSGLARTSMDIDVKSWYIEFDKDGNAVSNDIVIDLSEIYPGMKTITEKINIKNKGDSQAQISYDIVSANILDDNLDIENSLKEDIVDKLSHDYPFHINISLSKPIAVSETGNSELTVSISWPLDSDNDKEDSFWGAKAYDFIQMEKNKANSDKDYQMKSPVRIIVSLKAEQALDDENTNDYEYMLGNTVLYDISLNKRCQKVSDTCLKTNVVDLNNKMGEESVLLLPTLYNTYPNISNWSSEKRLLHINDVIKIIATDIENTQLVRDNLSDMIIGNIKDENRTNEVISNLVNNNYIRFSLERFSYLASSKKVCLQGGYMIEKLNETTAKVSVSDNSCEDVYILIANKDK